MLTPTRPERDHVRPAFPVLSSESFSILRMICAARRKDLRRLGRSFGTGAHSPRRPRLRWTGQARSTQGPRHFVSSGGRPRRGKRRAEYSFPAVLDLLPTGVSAADVDDQNQQPSSLNKTSGKGPPELKRTEDFAMDPSHGSEAFGTGVHGSIRRQPFYVDAGDQFSDLRPGQPWKVVGNGFVLGPRCQQWPIPASGQPATSTAPLVFRANRNLDRRKGRSLYLQHHPERGQAQSTSTGSGPSDTLTVNTAGTTNATLGFTTLRQQAKDGRI